MSQRGRHVDENDQRGSARTSESPRVERTPGTPADAVLDLQRLAGNRTVVAMLRGDGPDPRRAGVQRDEDETVEDATTAGDPEAMPLTETASATSSTMTIPDLDLVLPIASFGRAPDRQGATGGGTGRVSANEVSVTLPSESLDNRISSAVLTGDRWSTVVLAMGSGTALTLRSVTATAFSTSGGSASLTLGFASSEYAAAP